MRFSSSQSELRITGLRTYVLSAPYEPGEEPEWSAGVLPAQVATLVEVTTDSGLCGIGECQAGVFAPTAIDGVVSHFEQFLLGRDPLAIEALVTELAGGIQEAKDIIRYAAARRLGAIPHSWGSAPALMANYHLAFSCPTCFVIESPTTSNPLVSELLVEPLQREDGVLKAPTQPGLGVQLPDDVEERFPFIPASGYSILKR